MLVRIRWFLLGAATTAWCGLIALGRLARARERFTPQNMARETTRLAADWLDRVGESVAGGAARR